jgi:hypothetical protein
MSGSDPKDIDDEEEVDSSGVQALANVSPSATTGALLWWTSPSFQEEATAAGSKLHEPILTLGPHLWFLRG